MKIVNRKTFLALPENVVYYKVNDNLEFYEPGLKGRTIHHNHPQSVGDFYYQDLEVPIDARGADDGEAFMVEKAKNDPNFSIPLSWEKGSRDGCFDEDQLFAVFEEQDIRALIACLQRALPEGPKT